MVANVDPRANYGGGDFAGITQQIQAGYFDRLGVRSLWISPPQPNPEHGEVGADGRQYSGYHGYWPDDGRSIEKRFGDGAALSALVAAAHAHGIRVLVDSVLNHVHLEHPYYLAHRGDGWFNGDGTCVCGGPNCDWDTHRLDCWFAPYLPDLNYETFPALQAMVDDALTWARDYDVDGFRVDAVKHFPHAVGKRLRGKLHDQFEHDPTLSYYLVGETYTGASDGERQFIATFISPAELSAQFDFPMYWNMLGAFATNAETLRDLDGSAAADDAAFGTAEMAPFFGNHDVPRFITTAAGQLVGDGKDQAWTAPPAAPASDVPYAQLRLALAFLFTQPGVPLLYYGDEYGQPGAGDPDNRRFMKWSGYSPSEQATLDLAMRLGGARAELSPLQRGKRYTMWVDDDLYVYARTDATGTVVVGLNRSAAPRSQAVPVRPEAPLADGVSLADRLGGPGATPSGGMVTIDLPPRTACVLAP
jgi:glycosidase